MKGSRKVLLVNVAAGFIPLELFILHCPRNCFSRRGQFFWTNGPAGPSPDKDQPSAQLCRPSTPPGRHCRFLQVMCTDATLAHRPGVLGRVSEALNLRSSHDHAWPVLPHHFVEIYGWNAADRFDRAEFRNVTAGDTGSRVDGNQPSATSFQIPAEMPDMNDNVVGSYQCPYIVSRWLHGNIYYLRLQLFHKLKAMMLERRGFLGRCELHEKQRHRQASPTLAVKCRRLIQVLRDICSTINTCRWPVSVQSKPLDMS